MMDVRLEIASRVLAAEVGRGHRTGLTIEDSVRYALGMADALMDAHRDIPKLELGNADALLAEHKATEQGGAECQDAGRVHHWQSGVARRKQGWWWPYVQPAAMDGCEVWGEPYPTADDATANISRLRAQVESWARLFRARVEWVEEIAMADGPDT